jgi:hypothetical protein
VGICGTCCDRGGPQTCWCPLSQLGLGLRAPFVCSPPANASLQVRKVPAVCLLTCLQAEPVGDDALQRRL